MLASGPQATPSASSGAPTSARTMMKYLDNAHTACGLRAAQQPATRWPLNTHCCYTAVHQSRVCSAQSNLQQTAQTQMQARNAMQAVKGTHGSALEAIRIGILGRPLVAGDSPGSVLAHS